jgi:arylsulfatase
VGIRARGEVRSQYTHVVDITPTILEALGLEAPSVLNHVPQRPLEGVSFAHTFADAHAPTRKRVQYYEMIASRAIWADGWKAVAEQPQGEMLTDEMLAAQTWELYHVAEDFSETRNLAAEHPDKLARLVELWWAEAGKYNVLPLDSRMQLRMGERKPGSRAPSLRHVFEPFGAPQFEYTAVNLKNRSHSISADVRIPPDGTQGVLFAHGSWFSGYSLYVKDDRLVYVHNYLGLQEYRIVSTQTLPRGDCTLTFVFTRTGEHCGHGRLLFNGVEVGAGEIPRTIPAVIETSGEGQCCGYDSGLPVTHDYEAPFRFGGLLRNVVIELEPGPGVDTEAQLRSALTDH